MKYVISNVNPDSSPLTVGYYVREVGIYAHVTGESEILYAVAIADADTADYMPEYDELQPATITMDWFITVGNTENITIQASPSAYALAEDLEELALVVDEKLDANGDSKNNTVSFTSSDAADSDVTKSTGWETVAPLASGETHESFMTKFSKIVKNLRWLYKLIGTTDISSIGNGTVTNALSVLNAKSKLLVNYAVVRATTQAFTAQPRSATQIVMTAGAETGYIPLGIVGVDCGNNHLMLYYLAMGVPTGTIKASLQNETANTYSGTFVVNVLYVRDPTLI